MANNPFDPPIVQIKKVLDRGGVSTVNRGFGSTRTIPANTRPAPAPDLGEVPQILDDLDDVDTTTTPPTDGQVLKYEDSSGLWIPGTVAGGGGGSGADRRWTVGSGETSIDEFNDESLNGAWAVVRHASIPAGAFVTYSEGADSLSSLMPAVADGATARHQALQRPLGTSLAVGDAIITAFTVLIRGTAPHRMGGIMLSDSATATGEQLYFRWWTGANIGMRRMTNLGGDTTLSGSPQSDATYQHGLMYSRIVRISATTWRGDVSMDGVSWIKGTSAGTWAFEPTHVGVCESNWNTAVTSIVSYEFLRRVSGVT